VDADLVWAISMGVSFVSWGAMAFAGWAYWVRKKASMPAARMTPELEDAIRDEVDRALAARDGELAELHERIDFAERVLGQLGPGQEPT
jgi:hypothetical protein